MSDQNQKPSKRFVLLSILSFFFLLCIIVFYWVNKSNDIDSQHATSSMSDEKEPITKSVTTKTVKTESSVDNTQLDSNHIQDQLSVIADMYQEQARYPASSLVIDDIDLARAPEPFEQANVGMKLFDKAGNLTGITIDASVDKIQYFEDEPIIVRVLVNGANEYSSINASVEVKSDDNDSLFKVRKQLSAQTDSLNEYRITLDTRKIPEHGKSSELLAKINVQIDGQQFVTTVPFYYSYASAQIQRVVNIKQNTEYLDIPLEYDVYEAGYYYATAYLDDALTQRPLIKLQAEGRLDEGTDQLIFKAHHQALKDAGSQGPYSLRIAHSFRGANPGEGNDVPVSLKQTAFHVNAVTFDSFGNNTYTNSEVDERLSNLRDLVDGGG